MILLIQFRTDFTGPHEVKCVYEGTGLSYGNFNILNVSSANVTTEDLIEWSQKADKIMIGGWAENGYEAKSKEDKAQLMVVREKTLPFIKYLIDKDDKPVFGFCLGHQMIADCLGSPIKQEQGEAGIYNIKLTEEGQNDLLFAGMGKSFYAVSAHKSSAMELPKGAKLLATNDTCQIHAFRVNSKIYGVQFHAELNYEDMMYRINYYQSYRANGNDENNHRKLKSKKILHNFVNLVE